MDEAALLLSLRGVVQLPTDQPPAVNSQIPVSSTIKTEDYQMKNPEHAITILRQQDPSSPILTAIPIPDETCVSTITTQVPGKSFLKPVEHASKTPVVIEESVTPLIPCRICGETFSSATLREEHFDNSHRAVTCEVCNKGFISKSYLNMHMRVHTKEKPHSCHICSKKFSQHGNLQRHIRLHNGEKPHSCSECGRSFVDRCSMKKHAKTHAVSSKNKNRECGPCGVMFEDSKAKYNHDETIHRLVKCQVCGKGFGQKSFLIVHMRVHTNERPFECDQCEKAFTQRGNLARHLRVHAGEMEFQCDVCSRRFNDKGNLKKHRDRHLAGLNTAA